MTTPAEIADALRATSFLEDFTDAHLWKLSRLVTPLTLVPDDTIFSEGEARQRFAILISGAVALACGAILVIFTDIETGFVRWVNCGPLGGPQEHRSELCR